MKSENGTIGDAVVRFWARGVVGMITAALAVLACYGTLALAALLPLIGGRLVLADSVWAATIAVFVVLTVLAVIPGLRHHRSPVPGLGALVGGGLILYALLVKYHVLVELVGFLLLAGAAIVDAFLRRRARRGIPEMAGGYTTR